MWVTVLFVVVCLTIHVNCQFVVDSKNPIVIHDGSGEDSLFGYSLAFIKGSFGDRSSNAHGILFIGAPTEKSYTKNSGAIWWCKFSENVKVECSIDSKISDTAPISKSACKNPITSDYPEPETEQWIGASLTASRNYLIACAPRLKLNGFEYVDGYSRKRCKNETTTFGGCYKTTSLGSDPTLLDPLNDPSKFYFRSQDSGTGQPIEDYWFMYAEYGLSSHTTSSESLIVGAPSARRWTGMYVEHLKQNPRGRYIRNEPIIYNTQGNIPGVEAHSLLGYAITSGKIQGDGGEYIAVGAPRAQNLLGSVVISSSQSLNRRIIIGSQYGSYFGYSLATANLNGIGAHELLVGAPLWTSDFNSPHGFSSGSVQIFEIDVTLEYRLLTELLIPESNYLMARGARFGSAIVTLGDINNDQKDDFAVSAPYHGSGVGTVFIYYGGGVGYPLVPVQKIHGKSLDIPLLRGFGTFLLSGTLDVDGNTTPDLAVASYPSNRTIIFRTRPIAQAKVRVSYHSTDQSRNEIDKFLPTQDKLIVIVCVEFHFSITLPQDNQLDTWVKFEADSKESRFEFDDGKDAEYQQRLFSIQETCLERRLKLKQDVSVESNANPILFRAGVWYNATEPLMNQPVRPVTISLPQHQSRQPDANGFNPFLPSPIPLTHSEFAELVIARDDCAADGNLDCNPDLKLKLNVQYEDEKKQLTTYARNQPLVIGQINVLILTITLKNDGETAYRPTLNLNLKFSNDFEIPTIFGKDWHWQITDSSGKVYQPKTNPKTDMKNGVILGDLIKRPQSLQKGKSITYELRVGNLKQIKVLNSLKGKLEVMVEAFPEAQPREKVKVDNILIPLEAKFNIELPPPPMTTKPEIDPRNNRVDLIQVYSLRNTGISSAAMDRVKIEIFVPTHAQIKKNLTRVIGVVNPIAFSERIRCEGDADDFVFFNPNVDNTRKDVSSTQTENGSKSRSTRSAKKDNQANNNVEPARPSMSTSDKVITFSGCNPPSTSCRKITCKTDLLSLEQRVIQLHMYLLPNAAAELISEETTEIRIQTSISVTYLDKAVQRKGETMRKFVIEKGIAAWKLLVAGAGGTILFLIIAFILFKRGFFRRKTKEELQQLKRQTVMLQGSVADESIQEDDDAQQSDGNTFL